MDAIRTWLLIGKYRDTLSQSYLQFQQIQALLTFAEPVTHPNIICHYLAVEDGVPLDPGTLRKGLAFIHDHYQNNHRVLVACGAGISRSATFVIAALKEIEQISLIQAAQTVYQVRPSILPHIELWNSLCTYYAEQVPYLTLVQSLQDRS